MMTVPKVKSLGGESRQKAAYRLAFDDASRNCPGDPIAQHRFAEAASRRALRISESVQTSRDDVKSAIDAALQEAFPGKGFSWLESQTSGYIIVRGPDGLLYAIPHNVADGGGINWGAPEEMSGQLDSADAILGAFDGGPEFAPIEVQAPHVIATGPGGKLYSFGHSVDGGVLSWDAPKDFTGNLRVGS